MSHLPMYFSVDREAIRINDNIVSADADESFYKSTMLLGLRQSVQFRCH